MIDIENLVYDTLAKALRSAHTGIFVKGEYVAIPDSFPCATIEMKESAVDKAFRSTSGIENITKIMFEVNVYSNKEGTKKKEAKSIMATVDTKMSEYGFTRTMYSPVPNLNDATIYRLTARYEASIGGGTSANQFLVYNN